MENSVQCKYWDSNHECLKFDKVGKHSSSTKIITVNNYQCIIFNMIKKNPLPAIHINKRQCLAVRHRMASFWG